ncbi:MAG: hypothetical protein GY795_00285 [Desulfobacterales bacterium]|nr:hypothetical protein [Desulfobacterales bacterium]
MKRLIQLYIMTLSALIFFTILLLTIFTEFMKELIISSGLSLHHLTETSITLPKYLYLLPIASITALIIGRIKKMGDSYFLHILGLLSCIFIFSSGIILLGYCFLYFSIMGPV